MSTKEVGMKTAKSLKEQRGYKYDFVKYAYPVGIASIVLTVLALAIIFTKGFNYGIDFSGGTELQVKFEQSVTAESIREALRAEGVADPSVQAFGEDGEFLIRLGTPELKDENAQNEALNAELTKVRGALSSKLGMKESDVLRVDTVGPQVGSELKKNGLLAAFYSFLVILIYISIRFDYVYAPGAILCLAHDAIMTLGIFALLGREVNVQIIASILTLIGYSLNDTIVTFDRIRETAPLNRDKSLADIINIAINDTLGRTFLTAGSTLLACIGLYWFGGGVIAEISFTLIIGILVGTYSSIYVAAPLIIVMEKIVPSGSIPHGSIESPKPA
ncbi:MAG: protein translocase subunit SecF [Bdellovibrionales bacterium]|jgi:preprotein translocase subunit SecF|nr:protein translocase subunit SecF [Bdellovibrionales bacterium]